MLMMQTFKTEYMQKEYSENRVYDGKYCLVPLFRILTSVKVVDQMTEK